jgi:phage major head subunit gpT-like protein
MDINRDNMDALFNTYNTAFSAGMQSAGSRPTPEHITIEELAMLGTSTGAAAIHAWLNQIGGMRKWVGDRVLANLESGKLTVANEDYEKTVTVPRNDIMDDQYGLYAPVVQSMGVAAGSIWMRLGVDALTANRAWADELPFFSDARKYGDQDIVNVTTDALTAASYKAAKVKMESFVLHGGEPGEVVVTHLVVGPTLRDAAWDIVKNEWVSSGTGKGGAIKNPHAGSAELRVSPRLVGANANKWYMLGTQGGIKGVYVQKREEPRLTRMDRDTDMNVFMSNKYYYGTSCRGSAFLTLPHLVFGGIVDA